MTVRAYRSISVPKCMSISLGKLAVQFGCELRGDPNTEIDRVGTLQSAGDGCITFLANPFYRESLAETQATAVILNKAAVNDCPTAALITPDPYLVYAHVATLLQPSLPLLAGVHESVSVGADCAIPESCEVAPGAVLGDAVVLGERVYIGPNCVVGRAVVLGDDTLLMAGVTLYSGVCIGQRCLLHSGSVVGADGFGIAKETTGAWTKVPQLGGVRIGDDVEIGANTTIDRGAIEDTVIANGVKLDNQIQVAHNVTIGEHTVIAGQAGISGSVQIGARCMFGGQVGVVGHIRIADDVVVMGRTMVTNSIKKPGVYAGGAVPMDEAPHWRKNAVRFGQLDGMARRLRRVEKKLLKRASDDKS